jgi:hypothetical protein
LLQPFDSISFALKFKHLIPKLDGIVAGMDDLDIQVVVFLLEPFFSLFRLQPDVYDLGLEVSDFAFLLLKLESMLSLS